MLKMDENYLQENNGSVFKMWVALHNKAKIFQSSDNIVLEACCYCIMFGIPKSENSSWGKLHPGDSVARRTAQY